MYCTDAEENAYEVGVSSIRSSCTHITIHTVLVRDLLITYQVPAVSTIGRGGQYLNFGPTCSIE